MEEASRDPIKQAQSAMQSRDLSGKFSKVDPPLISFSLTNPVTYLRKWWKAAMDGEGVDIRLKIHPFTVVAIVLAVSGVSFGLGRITVPEPIAGYVPFLMPTPVPIIPEINPWRDAAFVGTLQKQGDLFYLLGNDARAIRLEGPGNVLLANFVGRKILASGSYNAETLVLKVSVASDLELITGSLPVPTTKSTPSATPSPTPVAEDISP